MDSGVGKRFYAYGFRLIFTVLVAAMLCTGALAGLSIAWKALPFTISVKSVVEDDTNDAAQDDYPVRPRPLEPEPDLVPGGSSIARGIDDALSRFDVYNADLQKLSETTFGAPMRQGRVTRDSLFEDNDDWAPGDTGAAPDAAPAPMAREITLFNF